jgi:hypothetical protein
VTDSASYSISVRVQRVTIEEAYVKVAVDGSVVRPEPEADGTYRLDGEKVMAEATRLASHVDDWRVEELTVSVHPIQKAPDGLVDADGPDT